METDEIENDPTIARLIAQADKLAKIELKDHASVGGIGFCHVFWEVKKRILKERFGVEWKSPAEMNKGVLFD